ncbi:hypothetical protein KPL74_21640 [Bacillus sp. NP157]|nr:hypothetical protein KPL74_21640 [Bacillus sp. NP157]
MQISSFNDSPARVSVASAVPTVIAKTMLASEKAAEVPKSVDFSRVTPRRLGEYINEMIFAGRITREEVSALELMMTPDEELGAPDVPINVRARMEGHRDFLLDLHDARASFYTGMLDRLDALEATGLGISMEA